MRPGSKAFFRLTKPVLFAFCLVPFLHLLLGAFGLAGVNLGANPVEAIQDSLGQWGLRFLLIVLAVAPLQRLARRPWLLRYRRMLGLFAFFYVAMHFLTYLVLDLGLDFGHITEDILERPFITIGMLALLMLVPLAVTSTRGMMRRLGRRWGLLHRLVYPIAVLGVWHYYWQVKLDTVEPTIYALLLALLLGERAWRARRRRLKLRELAIGLVLVAVLGPGHAGAFDLRLNPVSARTGVVDIRNAGDGSGRLFLVERAGTVRIVRNGEEYPLPFLDISDRVSGGNEQGLLSLAFAPDYSASGLFYAWYTDSGGDTVLSRFAVTASPDLADAASEQVILTVDQPVSNHNGGRLVFGPDGMLYLGLGDGGGAGDPNGNGQFMNTLLGKIIRIDVDPAHGTYAIPADNPFLGQGQARDEIWAVGLRNPWRMSFDRASGDLYVADVGQDRWEEINFQPVDSSGGENYGWNRVEGPECFNDDNCSMTGLTAPVHAYSHAEGCSVTGGEVYRGNAYPDLHGSYLYGDFCTGTIWGLARNGDAWRNEVLLDSDLRITTFGEGEQGSIHVASSNLGVFLLSDGEPRPERPFSINSGLNDAWHHPAIGGQGVSIIVYPEAGVIFVSWFTYDLDRPGEGIEAELGEPGHRWLTAQGGWQGTTATLDIYLTQGGRFDRRNPVPQTGEPIGTMTLEFHDCTSVTMTYDIPSLGRSGSRTLQRLAPDNVAVCEALSAL